MSESPNERVQIETEPDLTITIEPRPWSFHHLSEQFFCLMLMGVFGGAGLYGIITGQGLPHRNGPAHGAGTEVIAAWLFAMAAFTIGPYLLFGLLHDAWAREVIVLTKDSLTLSKRSFLRCKTITLLPAAVRELQRMTARGGNVRVSLLDADELQHLIGQCLWDEEATAIIQALQRGLVEVERG